MNYSRGFRSPEELSDFTLERAFPAPAEESIEYFIGVALRHIDSQRPDMDHVMKVLVAARVARPLAFINEASKAQGDSTAPFLSARPAVSFVVKDQEYRQQM